MPEDSGERSQPAGSNVYFGASPDRKFEFKWDSYPNTLRVTKVEAGLRKVAWVQPNKKLEIHGPNIKHSDRKVSRPPATGPADLELKGVELLLQNQEEDSGKAEKVISFTEELGDPTGFEHAVSALAKDAMGLVDSDAKVERASCGPPSGTTALLVWVDLAENISTVDERDANDGVLVLGSNHEVAAHAEPQSPMVCQPLAVIEPPVQKVMVSGISGEKLSRGVKRSKWVNQPYQEIYKLMGFPIDGHEQQCLDLLRRIKASRDSKRGEIGSRKVTASKPKDVRELKI